MAANYEYQGDELEIFAHASNWKAYFRERLSPYIKGDVAEIGAGLGSTPKVLAACSHDSWACVEPDPSLAAKLIQNTASIKPRVVMGTIESLTEKVDTILYIDVLEHIENDETEVQAAVDRLRPDGHLIVLSPAHQQLFSPFDKAVGHFRRYSRASLERLSPRAATLQRIFYLDSVGLLASVANRLLLRQALPTNRQIATWDRWMIPASRICDRVLNYRLGKTVVGIWTAKGTTPALEARNLRVR